MILCFGRRKNYLRGISNLFDFVFWQDRGVKMILGVFLTFMRVAQLVADGQHPSDPGIKKKIKQKWWKKTSPLNSHKYWLYSGVFKVYQKHRPCSSR